MNSTPLHLAKREMQRFFQRKPLWVGTLAAGAVLGIAGPFGTDDTLTLLPRIGYWVLVACITFPTASAAATAITAWHRVKPLPIWARLAIAAWVGGLVVLAEVTLINALLLGFWPKGAALWILAANILAATAIITVTYYIIETQYSAPEGAAAASSQVPALLSRLPLEKRGALVSISVSDHYVDVTTTKGTDMLLLRFGDAITETAPTPGLQIHRSHWVATDQITSVDRAGGKTHVVLTDGRSLPVSRTFLPDLKAAGLMPGAAG